MGGGVSTSGEYAGVGQKTNLWVFYSQALLDSQGPALLALSLLGATLAISRRRQGAILHLSFVVPFFLLIAGASTAHLYYPRYLVPLLPGLCLLAGLALDDLVKRLQGPANAGVLVAAATALLFVVEPGMSSVRWNERKCRVDTRTMAAEWIEENVAHRARVLLEGFPEEPAQLTVPLRNTKANVREMITYLQNESPGKALFWELKVETQHKPMYDLVTVRHFEPWGTLDEYVADEVEYVVLRRGRFVKEEADTSKHREDVLRTRFRFYQELEESETAELLASFEAAEDGAPGYDLEIWRIQPTPRLEQASGSGSRREPASRGGRT
jgi:hypothetical protein